MKKKTIGIFSVLAISLLTISMVFAYQGDLNVKGPDFSEERHDAMQQAFEDLDYQAWYDLMTENGRTPKIVTVITADNFDEFVEARNAAHDGDLDSFKEFRQSLGLGLGKMKHGDGEGLKQGKGLGFKQGFKPRERQGNCPLAE